MPVSTSTKLGIGVLALLAAFLVGYVPASLSARAAQAEQDRLTDALAFARLQASATPEQKARLETLSSEDIRTSDLAGERIQTILTGAPGDGAPLGGVKVVAEHGWFAARPSGTEIIYKIYAESFRGEDHLRRILEEAQTIVNDALAPAPQRSGLARKTDVGKTG